MPLEDPQIHGGVVLAVEVASDGAENGPRDHARAGKDVQAATHPCCQIFRPRS